MSARTVMKRLRAALADERGSIAEAIAGTVIVCVLGSTLAYGAVNNVRLVSETTATAERQNAVSSLVGEQDDSATWGTTAAPKIQTVDLPSHATSNDQAALWAVPSITGVTYHASMPRSGTVTDPRSCLVATAKDDPNCVVASDFQALTISQEMPTPVVRKDPSGKDATGNVNASVATGDAIPQEGVIATFAPGTAASTTWRYLVKASDGFGNPSGVLRFKQGTTTLASIPTDGSMHNYFGTFVTASTAPVTLVAADDPNVVDTVFVYKGVS
ncbi:hypothetical protein [Curtobacterium sp. MCBD17_040]|uniref:hypothetical protein n=1 Tax=Curtobacterium sp. MCBD17_040 TaxID=2175674 RepID=UPI0011B40989|nr:hypothetical protein [Curtobacterium sp. MCBD17_040]WIB65649.1 hypothetical protein DEI94_16140 [Curtobacterium sp. MCBD17_040]